MAFQIYKTDDGRVLPLAYMPVSAIAPKVGQALKLTEGQLAVASGTDVPLYLSACEMTEAAAAGDIIPVVRVGSDVVFVTAASEAMTAVKPGDKVTLSADGLSVTATTASGVAEVVALEGTAIGDRVFVRFPG